MCCLSFKPDQIHKTTAARKSLWIKEGKSAKQVFWVRAVSLTISSVTFDPSAICTLTQLTLLETWKITGISGA
jgi:hypothetical protein